MITIILPGEPIAKIRPRITHKGSYDPQSHLKHAAKFQILDQIKGYDFFPFPKDVPVELEIDFYFPMPKGEEKLCSWGLLPMTGKKDLDNLEKFYLDVMSKIIYEDDRQVNILHSRKLYDTNPRTELIVRTEPESISDKVKEILSMISREELIEIEDKLACVIENIHIFDYVEHKEIAIILCELAEKYGETLRKINKKFPGYAEILKEEK